MIGFGYSSPVLPRRIMVTGSREWRDMPTIAEALAELGKNTSPWDIRIMQGCASGADAIARAYAVHFGYEVEDYWPEYHLYSFADANKRRNLTMVNSRPELVLAFPTARSRGTIHAINAARRAGILVKEFQERK